MTIALAVFALFAGSIGLAIGITLGRRGARREVSEAYDAGFLDGSYARDRVVR